MAKVYRTEDYRIAAKIYRVDSQDSTDMSEMFLQSYCKEQRAFDRLARNPKHPNLLYRVEGNGSSKRVSYSSSSSSFAAGGGGSSSGCDDEDDDDDDDGEIVVIDEMMAMDSDVMAATGSFSPTTSDDVRGSQQQIHPIHLPYCKNGDLLSLIRNTGRLGEDLTRVLFYSLVSGVLYAHTLSIAHMDIKPDNVLIGDDLRLKLCDFGLSVTFDGDDEEGEADYTSTNCDCDKIPQASEKQSGCYAAPQVYRSEESCFAFDSYNPYKADSWSLGVLLFVMLMGMTPFPAALATPKGKQQNIYDWVRRQKWDGFWQYLNDSLLADRQIPPTLSPELKDLIQGLLQVNEGVRLSLRDVMAHPWFSPFQQQQQAPDAMSDGVVGEGVGGMMVSPLSPFLSDPSNRHLYDELQERIKVSSAAAAL